ncbi:MAG: hypothetical protein A3C82_02560 [Candidatus Wildermuthbacteria bacterium RIFCSPHIGHO2_02_FULL_47_12]|uniref:Divalent-cation tolerance protein CutA n=1 Tax=Candidatus Wildermuthbacteria bacterium RIFCSPHIGHO2_02_FULL_47_12 TaxID=1802451 RepID=A0A1G2R401_9BACT|nr:MAG: hypothetical protein A3C82_02560 [Candidatus Wildermuthbacteria bacterium RIFCSPHIGHO2_02_FULL_47_12]
MGNKAGYILVYTTVAKRSDAEKIAEFLDGKKLSACTQIVGPITSVCRWRGKLEKSKEWLCGIKTKIALYKNVEKVLKAIHPYELPEIVAIPIIKGSREYLEWMEGEI